MSKPRRASLGGRNSAAIAQNSGASEPQASTPEPAKEDPRPPRETSAPPTGRSAGGDTIRQAIYFPAELFEQAKGAYLADWRLSLIHISEPTRRHHVSRMPSSA